jgi:hypothetical protein
MLVKFIQVEIPTKLKEEIVNFCRVNSIDDVDNFMLKMLRQGFNIEKYGLLSPLVVTLPISGEVMHVTEPIQVNQEDISTKNKKEDKKDLYGE